MRSMKITLTSAILCSALLSIPALAQEMISVPHFDSVGLEGGGHVVVRYGDVQKVRLIQGSTQFTRFTVDDGHNLRIEACRGDCPRHYDLQVEIVTPQIKGLAVDGGGAIESEGNFPASHGLDLAIEGGGDIDARAMDAQRAEAAINGGGLIRVRAEGELTAAINGGGNIRYWGNPRVTQAIDGGGEVQRGE
jgi:hypothetical protein